MRSTTITLSSALAVAISLLASSISASPIEVRAPLQTTFTYVKVVSVAVPEPAVTAVCTGTVTSKDDCGVGCVAAPIAGLLGVETSPPWTCLTEPPPASWTSFVATSTCPTGEAVTTVSQWGVKTPVPACKSP